MPRVVYHVARRNNPIAPDSGLGGWVFDTVGVQSNTALSKGVQYFFKLRTGSAATVSNVIFLVGSAGATLSDCYVGLLNSSGTLLTGSADLSTSWQSTGIKTNALTTPQNIGPDTVFYATVLVGNGSTTPPSLSRGAATGLANGIVAAADGYRFGLSGSGLTALGNVDLASASANATTWWIGIS